MNPHENEIEDVDLENVSGGMRNNQTAAWGAFYNWYVSGAFSGYNGNSPLIFPPCQQVAYVPPF